MFDRLFLARNIRSELVKPPLHLIMLFTGPGQLLADMLDLTLGLAQARGTLLQRGFSAGEFAFLDFNFSIEQPFL